MQSLAVFPTVVSGVVSGVVFRVVLGVALGACADAPLDSPDAAARLIASWDPLVCGQPHRVVVELEDDDGAQLSASVPCNLGALTVDSLRFGVYRGRVYASAAEEPIRSIDAIELTIDQPIVRWNVTTPQ